MLVIVPMYLIFAGAFIALMASTDGEPPPALMVGLMGAFYAVFLFAIILVSVPFIFVFPLIADRQMKAIPAVKASFRAAKANLFGLMKMSFVYAVIGMFASCLCYFPALLFMPISFGAMFLVYRDIFPEEAKGLVESTNGQGRPR